MKKTHLHSNSSTLLFIHILKIAVLVILYTLVSMFSLSAQTPRKDSGADGLSELKALKIGDKVPQSLWDTPLQVVNHPTGQKTIKLSEYRNKKLIVLDFWATWCSACIAAMPRIKELENKYQKDVEVIAVTRDEASKAQKFLMTNETIKSLGIYSIVADTLLRTVFPHQLIPHYVWISSEGLLGAVTSSSQLTEGNIVNFLADKTAQIPSRELIDPERPLFLSDKMQLDDLSFFSVLTRDAVDGLPSGNRYRKENGIIRGRAITNSSLEFLFSSAARGILQAKGKQLLDKEIFVEVKDSSRFYPVTDRDILSNVFNYELVVPLEKADSLYQYMLADLNRYTSYRASLEKRKIKCLALRRKGDLSLIRSKGGKHENTLPFNKPSKITNYPLSSLVLRLNDLDCFALPVIDETGYMDHIDLSFSGDLDPKILKPELNAQGLDLKEVTRTREVLVIGDKY
ncbi:MULTISPECIES: TlpA disulfide reductase family protein [Sphingobacterium]|uniref:TlpA disulfide reductase family protein n=1 Tax=Sphingobacterium TaxID=28453 RepID=UPI00257FF358|nr:MULTISPECIES: TlpA disulfide reductase family protein [Sphingobacterium]